MSFNTLQKIDKIKSQIAELELEKITLTQQLKDSLQNLFDEKILTICDFNCLVGGILYVQKTCSEDNNETRSQTEQWQKDGNEYLKKIKKNSHKTTNQSS